MGRSPCCDHERGLKKGPWTPEEDQKLIDYICNHGHGSWRALPKSAGLNRCGKSCRLRWTNYLRPDIKRGKFSDEEEQIIINLHSVLGNKWSRIAGHLPGRTDNEIKNYWNTHLRKKLLQRGIDPKTHKPISDPNIFANLSQLLSASNLGDLMNPWDNAFRSLQADTAQLVKIQLLQSIMQLINTTRLPNIAENSLLGTHNCTEFEGLIDATNPHYNTDILQAPLEFPNFVVNSQLFNNFLDIDDSMTCFEGGFQPEVLNVNYTRSESALPALVSASVGSSTVNQIESKISPTYPSTHSPNSTIFDAWEKLLDEEANGPWKGILD